jgi:hypothetical protein
MLGCALAGLIGSHLPQRALTLVAVVAAAGFLSVWLVAFQTATYEARLAFTALPAIACLAALGLERWKLPVRFVLPAMGLIGTVVAIQRDVLAVNWT